MRKFPVGSPKGRKAARADYHLEACTIGAGIVQNKEILKTLEASGYDGYVSIEAEGPDSEDEAARVIEGLANLKRWLKEIDAQSE
jgi:sugar phosphate isomerase/epimerase